MTSKNFLWGAGFLALLYGAYRVSVLKRSVEFFQYSLSGLKFRVKSLQPEIIFSIQVYNPNQTAIPVNDFFGVIKQGDRILANFKNLSAINLGGKETQRIDISAKINVLSVVMQILRGQKINTLTVDAILKTEMFDMPIRKDVSLSALSGTEEMSRTNNLLMKTMGPRTKQRTPVQSSFLQYESANPFMMVAGSRV